MSRWVSLELLKINHFYWKNHTTSRYRGVIKKTFGAFCTLETAKLLYHSVRIGTKMLLQSAAKFVTLVVIIF